MTNFYNLKLTKTSRNSYYVSFYIQGRRYRYNNAKVLGLELYPNRANPSLRDTMAQVLLLEFNKALLNGWSPQDENESPTLEMAINDYRIDSSLSIQYQKALSYALKRFTSFICKQGLADIRMEQLMQSHVLKYLESLHLSPSAYNHELSYVSTILASIYRTSEKLNPAVGILRRKTKATLHKPLDNIPELLDDIHRYNSKLHLCCLLTYGCLLRPHQEIRNLRWGDFSSDLSQISLAGSRNKSGRNRIVPVSTYVREFLSGGQPEENIFTGKTTPHNPDFFKTLWSRYKAESKILQPEQTLYSFRHTGAINVFKKTASLVTLQQVMGHSSLKVTLGYLRGLDIPTLSVDDMPEL
jgi:integrase